MADNKKGLKKSLTGSGRMLTIIGGSVIVAVVVGMFTLNSFLGNSGPAATAQLQQAPGSGRAATGEGGDEEYQRFIEEQNRIVEQRALASGTSAFPTLNTTPETEDFCDLNCANERERLERELAAAAERERQLQRDLENARLLAAQQQQGAQGNRDYVEHQGHVYKSLDYQNAERRRMREEMGRLAERHRPQGAEFVATSGVITRVNAEANNRQQASATSNSGASGFMPVAARPNHAINAADVLYITLDMEANSDVPGPLRATVQGGRFNGSRVLGQFGVSNDYLVMTFNRMVTPEGDHIEIDAIAIDPDRRLIGLADRVDRHYLQRFGALMGAAFLQGYGKAVIASREVQVGVGNEVEVVSRIDTTKDKALAAMAEVGDELASIVRPFASRPPTVIKYADTGMGLLFLSPVEIK